MTAIVSLALWLFTGRRCGRHALTGPTAAAWTYAGPRLGRAYRSTRDGFMSPDKLILAVRQRDMFAETRPLRWYEQEA